MGLGAGAEVPLTRRCSPFAATTDAKLLFMQPEVTPCGVDDHLCLEVRFSFRRGITPPEIDVIVDAVRATLRRHGEG